MLYAGSCGVQRNRCNCSVGLRVTVKVLNSYEEKFRNDKNIKNRNNREKHLCHTHGGDIYGDAAVGWIFSQYKSSWNAAGSP